MRSFPWSGKSHPTSELGKRSKTVLKITTSSILHGFSLLSAVNMNIDTLCAILKLLWVSVSVQENSARMRFASMDFDDFWYAVSFGCYLEHMSGASWAEQICLPFWWFFGRICDPNTWITNFSFFMRQ